MSVQRCARSFLNIFQPKFQNVKLLHSSKQVLAESKVQRPVNYRRSQKTNRGGKYILLVIPAVTFGLGTWQVQRRKWKLELIQMLEERINAEPIPIEECIDDLPNMEYMRVQVRGTFEHDKEMHIGPRGPLEEAGPGMSVGGGMKSKGAHIVTPMQLQSGMRILVNRGWVPYDRIKASARPEGQVEGVVDLVGVVRDTDRRQTFGPKNNPRINLWFRRDVEEMARNAETEPIFLDAVTESTVKGGPLGGQTRVNIRNEHLSYILTWYSLSFITGLMWYSKYFKK